MERHISQRLTGGIVFLGLTGLIHQPLYRGIELVVMPSFNLEVFCKTIQDHKITFVYVAPPVVVHLARSDLVKKYDLSSLKMITSGAAPLTKELVDAVYKRLKIKVNQAYGLSETSPMTHTQVRTPRHHPPWNESRLLPPSPPLPIAHADQSNQSTRLALGRMVLVGRLRRQDVPKHVGEIHLTRRHRARARRARRAVAQRPQRVQGVLEEGGGDEGRDHGGRVLQDGRRRVPGQGA